MARRLDQSTWKRLGPARYRVVDLASGDVWDFEGPREVTLHMWGRDLKAYAVFKDRTRFKLIEPDLTLFEQALDAFEPKGETP